MLAACGGGGGGGGGTTTPPPGPPPGPGAASSYYLSGASGVDRGQGYSLTGIDPASGGTVTIPSSNLYSANLATIAEWIVTNGTASGAGTRYRVWTGSDGNIYSSDLGVVSGSTAPTTAQLSTYAAGSICLGTSPTALNDLANPSNSAIVFRDASAGCGTPADRFVTVSLSAGSTTAPPAPSINEPVAVVRDATGAITKVLFLIHTSPAAVGYASSFTATPTVLGPITGNGLNFANGDFTSLAVVPEADGSQVWLYRDFTQIFAVNLTTLGAPVAVFTAKDSDVIQLPVLVEGTTVYVAMTDSTNIVGTTPGGAPLYTCQIVRIATAAPLTTASGTIALQENIASGLTLVGIVGSNIVYFDNNVVTTVTNSVATYSGTVTLEAIPKTSTGLTGPATTIATATQPNSYFDTTSAPVALGSGLYYQIDTVGAGPGSGIGYQAWYYGGGQPVSIGSNGSILLGGVSASSVSTANPAAPPYATAILALLPLGGGLPSSSIAEYDGSGNAGAVFGAIGSSNNNSTYSGLALSEAPLQAGMPALVIVSGQQQNGNSAKDLVQFTPGKAGSLIQVTKNL